MIPEAAVRLEGVSRVFGRGRPDEVVALADVSVDIPRGEGTILRGPSGSGKSTLLGVAGAMVRPTAGRVRLLGRDVAGLPEERLTRVRRECCGFVFQQFHLVRGLSALENVLLPLYPLDLAQRSMRSRGRALLERFGVAGRERTRVELLSGGEQQRVAIARALVNDPPILLADEPSAHLDRALVAQLLEILAAIVGEGRTVVVASHDPRVCEHPFARTVVDLLDGGVRSLERR